MTSSAPGQAANPFDTGPKLKPPAPLTKESKAEILAALADLITTRAFVPGMDLTKWPSYLAEERDEIDVADDDYAFARAVNMAMHDFGVSHILFYPPREAAERHRPTAVGVGLSAIGRRDGVTVTTVAPQTSADAADIHEGDKILAINGQRPTSDLLRGPAGSEVEMRVQSEAGAVRSVRLRSTLFAKVPPATLLMAAEDVAVLRVWGFDDSYDASNVTDLLRKAAHAKYLVLDLRSNPGGDGSSVIHLLSLLLPADTFVGTFIAKGDLSLYLADHPGTRRADPVAVAKTIPTKFRTTDVGVKPFRGKIAVLINRGTSSAAEVAAEALRELAGATIVGLPSAGAVLDSTYRRLPYGYEVQFPVRDYVSQAGIRLERNPVHPDQEVSTPPSKGSDPALDAAIERLRNAR